MLHLSLKQESIKWASENNMKLNATKTKEVRVGVSLPDPGTLPPIIIDGHDIAVVPHAKLLGVIISKDLKWIEHVDYICKNASKRLYALRLLKRSSIPTDKLVRVYTTCVRPILDFSCEVWHYSLTQYLSDEIECIQRRALRIIFPDLKYEDALVYALGWCRCSCGERPFARNFLFKCVMIHPINSILSSPQDTKRVILFVMTIVFQYQSIGQVGSLIVLLWPVVRPITLVLNNNCLAIFLS